MRRGRAGIRGPWNRVRRIAALPVVACVLTTAAPAAQAQARSNYDELQTFADVLNLIRINYVDSVSYDVMVRAAVDGLLRALDPHSRFVSREAVVREAAIASGDLVPIGFVLEDVDGAPTVLTVMPGSPAARRGVAAGDRLVEVGDTTVAGREAKELERALAGRPGSGVTLTLDRGGRLEPERYRVTIRRETIRHTSVRMARMLDDSTGYVWLADFLPGADRAVEDAVRRVQDDGATRLVLDMRGNPGGNVVSAVDVASLFLPRHAEVFRTRSRRGDRDERYVTQASGPFRDLPVVLLVDAGTASAAEAVAASLQDHDRALVVGQRTFGKALLQVPFTLPAGDVVWLTVGWVFSPSGRLIQRRYAELRAEAYLLLAGRPGSADTAATFRTDGGRTVYGGGGVAPDVVVPAPPDRPVWHAVASDQMFDRAVADSVAFTLDDTDAERRAWEDSRIRWRERVLAPYLARVRAQLGVGAGVGDAVAEMLARDLAARVAEVRWGPHARDDLLLRYDPVLDAALALLPRLPELLASPTK